MTYTDNDNILRSYGYTYDEMNRLKGSYYQKEYTETNSYDEHLTYDKNGNILTLNRNGFLDQDYSGVPYPIDELNYMYENNNKSNRLVSVTDHTNSIDGFKDGNLSGMDYFYDEFGNMTADRNKGIDEILYNHLNLPTKIVFSNSSEIYYIYNAVGSKIRKRVVSATPGYDLDGDTHYISGFQYKNNELQFFPTAEGYVNVTDGGKFNYVYNYTDHLGNVRLSYAYNDRTSELNILEENHYYPFGLKHSNYNVDKLEIKKDDNGGEFVVLEPVDRNKYQYKFQGQERQDELSLNWDSFKWRNYDYAIGRFFNIDPLTEQYNTWSPYAFSGNRVIDSRELEGLEPHSVHATLNDAAKNFGQQYNGLSIRIKGEVGTQFYSTTTNKQTTYSYITPVGSAGSGAVSPEAAAISDPIPKGSSLVADGHTHGEDLNDIGRDDVTGKITYDGTNNFSNSGDYDKADKTAASVPGFVAFVVTPNGKVLSYTPNGNKDDARKSDVKRVSNEMPSDPNSVTRQNDISPNNLPAVLPNGVSQQEVDKLPKL